MITKGIELREEAFDLWNTSLDFMDAGLISKSAHFLECRLDETSECIPVNDTIHAMIDSVSSWHTAHIPSSAELKKSEKYLKMISELIGQVHGEQE